MPKQMTGGVYFAMGIRKKLGVNPSVLRFVAMVAGSPGVKVGTQRVYTEEDVARILAKFAELDPDGEFHAVDFAIKGGGA